MKVCIQIVESPKGGYTAVCLSLPGCAIRAQSRDLARKRIEEAIRGYLAAVGNFVPENVTHELVEA